MSHIHHLHDDNKRPPTPFAFVVSLTFNFNMRSRVASLHRLAEMQQQGILPQPLTNASSASAPQPITKSAIQIAGLSADSIQAENSEKSTEKIESKVSEISGNTFVSGAIDPTEFPMCSGNNTPEAGKTYCPGTSNVCSNLNVTVRNWSLSYQMAMVVRMYYPSLKNNSGVSKNTAADTETTAVFTLPRRTGASALMTPKLCCGTDPTSQRIDIYYYQLKDSFEFLPEKVSDSSTWVTDNANLIESSGDAPIQGLLPIWRQSCGDNQPWTLPGSSPQGLVLDTGRSSTNGSLLRRFSISCSSLDFVKNSSTAGLIIQFSQWPAPVTVTQCSSTQSYVIVIVLLSVFAVVLMAMVVWYVVETDPYLFKKD